MNESQLVMGKILERDSTFDQGSFLLDMKPELIMTSSSPYSILSSSFDETFTHSLAEPGKVLPPIVKMNYNGTEYDGKLIAYEFRPTDSF